MSNHTGQIGAQTAEEMLAAASERTNGTKNGDTKGYPLRPHLSINFTISLDLPKKKVEVRRNMQVKVV
jgi:hypothetical protein